MTSNGSDVTVVLLVDWWMISKTCSLAVSFVLKKDLILAIGSFTHKKQL